MSVVVLPSGLELCYESFGRSGDPVVVLVAGFGAQLLSWDSGLCERLAERGLCVVRFDNRDCGLSTRFDGVDVDLNGVIGSASMGRFDLAEQLASYTLRDMADDVVGLMSALAVDESTWWPPRWVA